LRLRIGSGFFDPARIEQDFEDKIGALVSSAGIRALRKVRKIEIPVCYDDEFALDLARVASQTFLTGDAIIALHSSIEYTVACIGFVPGFLSRWAVGQVACATAGKPANESSRWFRRDC
jgi:Allophanate hydrolase subunit 1